MQSNIQVSCAMEISAPIEEIWAILADSTLLPSWMPNVAETTIVYQTDGIVGQERACQVDLSGRRGSLVEKCVEFIPNQRIAYQVKDESFGMNRLINDLGYTMHLDSLGENHTNVRLEYRYEERGLFGRILNRFFIKPSWQPLCGDMIQGLKQFVETENTH